MADSIQLSWRDSRGPSTLSDVEILNEFGNREKVSIHELSKDRRAKSRLRLQCQYLNRSNLLNRAGRDLYSIGPEGKKFLEGVLEIPQSEGYFNLQSILNLSDDRITDVSILNQEDIKKRNYDIYLETKQRKNNSYKDYSIDVQDPRRERREVLSTKKWKLDRLLREFPLTEPVAAQCAHWITSIVSFHFFPDANHRTAMISLYQLALGNDVVDENHRWPGNETEIGKAVLLSKFHRHLSPKRNFERLWMKDALYWHWHQYFAYLLFDIEYPALNYHSENYLRERLNRVRNK